MNEVPRPTETNGGKRAPRTDPPSEPAAVGTMKGAGEAPLEPGKPSEWDIGGGAPEWGRLDLGGGGDKLPPNDNYDGTVSDLKISESFSTGSEKPDVLWMITNFGLDGWEASPAPRIEMIASHRGPIDQHRIAQGLRFLNRLAAATGTPSEKIGDPFELPDLFIGKKLNLTIKQKMRDGVVELVVGNGMRPCLK